MDRNAIIAMLRQHEAEFRLLGVESLSLFGSAARGETQQSDVDLAVKLDHKRMPTGFRYAAGLKSFARGWKLALGRRVDLVPEPARKRRFQNKSIRIACLPSKDVSQRLADIAEYAGRVTRYVAGRDREASQPTIWPATRYCGVCNVFRKRPRNWIPKQSGSCPISRGRGFAASETRCATNTIALRIISFGKPYAAAPA